MDELTDLLGSTSIYTPQQEFILLEQSIGIPYENWNAINTRNRYIRYLRNLDFSDRLDIEVNVERYITTTGYNLPYDTYEMYVLSQKIDFEIYTVVCNIFKNT